MVRSAAFRDAMDPRDLVLTHPAWLEMGFLLTLFRVVNIYCNQKWYLLKYE